MLIRRPRSRSTLFSRSPANRPFRLTAESTIRHVLVIVSFLYVSCHTFTSLSLPLLYPHTSRSATSLFTSIPPDPFPRLSVVHPNLATLSGLGLYPALPPHDPSLHRREHFPIHDPPGAAILCAAAAFLPSCRACSLARFLPPSRSRSVNAGPFFQPIEVLSSAFALPSIASVYLAVSKKVRLDVAIKEYKYQRADSGT